MISSNDRLEWARRRPSLAEGAVQTALIDAVAWRIGGGNAPGAEAFIAAGVAAARLRLDTFGSDSAERSRTLSAVARAAARFRRSALCRRLMTVPAAQLICGSQHTAGARVLVRDRQRRLHAIVLTARRDALEARRIAGDVARATSLSAADCLTPLRVHVFSLATGRRHVFSCDVLADPNQTASARVA